MGTPTRIIEAVVKVRDSRIRAMAKVIDALGGPDATRVRRVKLLGLTFKPKTDDMRDGPAISIAHALIDKKCMELAAPLMPGVTMFASAYEALEGAATMVTEGDAFCADATAAQLAKRNPGSTGSFVALGQMPRVS